MPDPLGKKSLPTKFSNTEDFPADWPPTTAIWGRSMVLGTPNWVKTSCILFMMGMRASMPALPAMVLVSCLWRLRDDCDHWTGLVTTQDRLHVTLVATQSITSAELCGGSRGWFGWWLCLVSSLLLCCCCFKLTLLVTAPSQHRTLR